MTSELINIIIRKNILGVGKKGIVVLFPSTFSELAGLIFQGGLRVTEKLKSPRSPRPARWVSASALGNMLHLSAKSLQLRHSVDTLMIHIDTSSIHIDTKPWFALGFALCVEHSMGFDKCAMSCGH